MSRALQACIVIAGLVAASGLARPQADDPGQATPAAAAPEDAARLLLLSDQARRFLALQYRAFPTEFMGCMIGDVRGRVVIVRRIAPADVDPSHSTATWVVPRETCERAGWNGTVGMIHSHPTGERCWYFFPGTQVPSSDGRSFLMAPYAVDAIMCGDRVVWINRAMQQHDLPLTPPRSPE